MIEIDVTVIGGGIVGVATARSLAARPGLSVIVPAYCEEKHIGQILAQIDAVDLSGLGLDKEVVVCDDGSPDSTSEIVEGFEAAHSVVKLVRHPVNRGKGAAIRTALREATGDIAIIQDADLEYDPRDYINLVAPIERGEAQIVYGVRALPTTYFVDADGRIQDIKIGGPLDLATLTASAASRNQRLQ